jgi:hypothetical protein
VAADAMAKTADVSQTASVLDQGQITAGGGLYEQSKIPVNAQSDAFDLWSQQRSSELARANALARNGCFVCPTARVIRPKCNLPVSDT